MDEASDFTRERYPILDVTPFTVGKLVDVRLPASEFVPIPRK